MVLDNAAFELADELTDINHLHFTGWDEMSAGHMTSFVYACLAGQHEGLTRKDVSRMLHPGVYGQIGEAIHALVAAALPDPAPAPTAGAGEEEGAIPLERRRPRRPSPSRS